MRRTLGIDRCVADARQDFRRDENETDQDDHERDHVHFRQPRAPGRDRDPQTADDDHDLDGEVASEPRSAGVRVRPERQRDAEGGNQHQACSTADHGRAL